MLVSYLHIDSLVQDVFYYPTFLKISSIRDAIFSYGSIIIELQSTKAISELDKCIDVTELINNESTKQNFIYGDVKYKVFKVLK